MLIRVGRSIRLPVRLLKSDGTPATGVAPADVLNTALYLYFANGEVVTVALTSSNWFEMGVGLGQPGVYHVLVDKSIWTTNRRGPFEWSVLPAGGGSSGDGNFMSGFTTTGVANGDLCYVSAANTVSKTDSTVATSSDLFGVATNIPGTVQIMGIVEDMNFTTSDGAPANGGLCWIALGTDDSGAGAGRATSVPPTTVTQIVAEVGIVVDNSNWAALKTCRVLLQVKKPILLQ